MASILAVVTDKAAAAPRRGLGWCNTGGLNYVEPAMTDALKAPLTIYTTPWCGYCHRLKTVLKASGISYDEIDIEQDAAAAQFVGSVNGGNRTVPTVKFADGSTLTNPGVTEVNAKLADLTG
jgi:mycoredoxin